MGAQDEEPVLPNTTVVAGNICNTNIYAPDDSQREAEVHKMFEEQVGWAVDAGVD